MEKIHPRPPARRRSNPASPCISVCSLDANDVCTGCRRTLDEIARWGAMSPGEREAVMLRLARRRLAS
jgi:predicted Fe-S protein YdhL (DUF1289 family)